MQTMSEMTPAKPRNRRRPAYVGRLSATAVGAGLVVAAVLPAGQAAAATSPGTTTANVAVGSAITLSNLTPDFTLSGNPGQTITDIGAVTMNVETNNATGYNVTVEAAAPALVGTGTNTDTIPIADLLVRETGTTDFTPSSNITPVRVHTQGTRSVANTGDNLSNDYQITIPNVHNDTYSVTLNYLATTNA
jgi:hypothetical protein